MTATVDVEPETGPFDGDAVTGWLGEVLTGLSGLAAGTVAVDDPTRIDRIALLERVKAAAAAAQCAEVVGFARSQVAAQQSAGVDYRRLGRGIGEQIALATHTSPWHGARTLTFARDLVHELPHTFGLLADGRISEYAAHLVATETSHLDPDTRRLVDGQLAAQHIDELGPKAAAGLARKLAYAADPHGAVTRARTARADRHVSLRPAPDTMTWFGALLPVEDGVACLAALTRHCDTLKAAGDERTRGQIMADTTVARLTGQDPADGRPVELNLTVPLDHLIDPNDHTPADLPGYGPIPAGLVDDILAKAKDRVWWRRLFTAPTTDRQGHVTVGGDPTLRRFGGWLAKLITLRDGGTCREPYCGAPIRHTDHIRAVTDGGPTTFSNGRGVCERDNYIRQLPGWQVEVLAYNRGAPEMIATTTPTGHTYLSRAPDPPKRM